MYNGWREFKDGDNQGQLAITHELDGVTFKLAMSLNSTNDQLLEEVLQKINSTNLNQYIYDFKLEERVLNELKTTEKRQ